MKALLNTFAVLGVQRRTFRAKVSCSLLNSVLHAHIANNNLDSPNLFFPPKTRFTPMFIVRSFAGLLNNIKTQKQDQNSLALIDYLFSKGFLIKTCFDLKDTIHYISCLDKISSDGHKRCLLSSLNVNPYNSNRIYTIINSIITVATVSALSSVNTPFLNLSIALRFDVRHYN